MRQSDATLCDHPHPGEILEARFLAARSLTQLQLAGAIQVSLQTVNMIINGKRGITADMALRLGQALATGAEYWMNLQRDYDLSRRRRLLGSALDQLRVLSLPAAKADRAGTQAAHQRGGRDER